MSSKIWKYFKVVDDNESKALCKLCDVKLLRGKSPKTFSTKPLWNHLKSAHNTQHDLIKLSKGDKTVGADVDVDDVVVVVRWFFLPDTGYPAINGYPMAGYLGRISGIR